MSQIPWVDRVNDFLDSIPKKPRIRVKAGRGETMEMPKRYSMILPDHIRPNEALSFLLSRGYNPTTLRINHDREWSQHSVSWTEMSAAEVHHRAFMKSIHSGGTPK